jgi:hypothetical protein
MLRHLLSTVMILSVLALGASVARADEAGEQHHGSRFTECKADMEKFCKDSQGDRAAMHKCMKEHEADLSDACKAARARPKKHE